MTVLVGRFERYSRVELNEGDYGRLIGSLAPHLFRGFRWYEFTPPIVSPHGTAHPDAALVSVDGSEWWVVEIELTRHSSRDHVEPQLRKLQDGWYGSPIRAYFDRKYPDALLPVDRVLRQPKHLLILDDRSSLLAEVGNRVGFQVMYLIPFLSDRNHYILSADGWHPPRLRPPSGVQVELLEDEPVARLSLTQPVTLPTHVKVGGRVVRAYVERRRECFVLAMSRSEFCEELGSGPRYLFAQGQVFTME